MPAADPLKLYVSIDHPPLREEFGLWLRRWRDEKAAGHGAVETALLLTPGGGGFEVIWQGAFIVLVNDRPQGWDRRILQNVEKRLRARPKR